MHRARAGPLVITPRFAAGPRGIFATRAPDRPNPIGLSVVAFAGFEAPGVLLVRNLDCANGTPLLDIKPYLPHHRCRAGRDAWAGWRRTPLRAQAGRPAAAEPGAAGTLRRGVRYGGCPSPSLHPAAPAGGSASA